MRVSCGSKCIPMWCPLLPSDLYRVVLHKGTCLPCTKELRVYALWKRDGFSSLPLRNCHWYLVEWVDIDENFILQHNHRGTVSLVNKGPHSNGSSFMITLQPMAHFDYKYVVIGAIVLGEETLQKMEQVSCRFEKPDHEISIQRITLL
jgi:hypothetical protein